jgi:hypothetical protein
MSSIPNGTTGPLSKRRWVLLLPWLVPTLLCGQDPNLVTDNLQYSRELFATNHLVMHVTTERGSQQQGAQYRYDRLAEVKRIAEEDGMTYAQLKGQAWLKSKDWGKSGLSVTSEKAHELDQQVQLAEAALAEPDLRDKGQGGSVWKLIDQTEENNVQTFSYERTRERPKPDGVYPRYSFVKYKDDVDGKLMLNRFVGQLRAGKEVVTLDAKFGVIIILPASAAAQGEPQKK